MKNKTNTDHLRELINSDSYSKEEALEFILAIEDELSECEQELKDEKDDCDRLEADNEELQESVSNHTSIFLGLDTLHYRLEKGNLKIQQQLENWIDRIKEQN